uniref:Uncharacterized protein n=1 Tax=Neogobius melanostomus TaxID=47308 RepID=A0A8C6SLY5_9GOBI
MSEGEDGWECGSDVSRLVQGEQLQVYPGLLALSSVCGVVSGLLTAALLLRFCVRPFILTRQGYNIRRLLEPEEAALENSPNGRVNAARNTGPRASSKDNPEKKPPPVSGDVAAFATRAKVVYPINQKYRVRTRALSYSRTGQNGGKHFVSSVLPQSLQNHSFTPTVVMLFLCVQCQSFSNQVENLSQLLLSNTSVIHPEEAQEIISSISKNLALLEKHLQTCQDSLVQEKVQWWQELEALLQSQPALLRRETCLRQSLVSTALEQMTSDRVLTFSQMEKILWEIQEAQSDECLGKTSELVTEKMSRLESKRRKMLKNQSKERRVLEQPQRDLQGLLRHRQQLKDLELQQELRLTDAITDLRSSWSSRLADQCRCLLLSSLSTEAGLTQDRAEGLWSDLEQALSPKLHEAESCISEKLQETRGRLHREGKTWRVEMVLAEVCFKHLSDHQTNSLQALELRQSYSLHDQAGRLLALKHLHLLGALRRLFVVRHVSLNLLKEMRLSLQRFAQRDFGSCLWVQSSIHQSCGASAKQRRWAKEHRLLEQSLKQEFLSELETGAELLQWHLQTILGNALSHSVQQEMERESFLSFICRLTEAASESVYLTKDSLCALVQKYYSQLQRITGQLQQEPARLSDDCTQTSLFRELQNWSRKPRSAEFQQRVEQHKRRLLFQTDREQQRLWEELRRRKVTRDIGLDKVKDQLMVRMGIVKDLSILLIDPVL